jgi:hypothetical protein
LISQRGILLEEFFWNCKWMCMMQGKIKQGVCHTMALPFTSKKYLKAKKELWKFKYLTIPKYNLQIFS